MALGANYYWRIYSEKNFRNSPQHTCPIWPFPCPPKDQTSVSIVSPLFWPGAQYSTGSVYRMPSRRLQTVWRLVLMPYDGLLQVMVLQRTGPPVMELNWCLVKCGGTITGPCDGAKLMFGEMCRYGLVNSWDLELCLYKGLRLMLTMAESGCCTGAWITSPARHWH